MNLDLATLALIAINTLVSLKGFNDYNFFDRYKFMIGPIQQGQRDRMFTSGFLHVDLGHLFLNMFTLYFFADVVIRWFGSFRFLILYGISLFAGSLLALFFHKKESYYSAVGASGAVTGVLYSSILLQPKDPLYFIFLPTVGIPAYILGVGYLLYSIYGMKTRQGNIGHTAHFGGAVGGYLVTLIYRPELLVSDTLTVALLAVPILLLLALERAGKL